MLAVSGMAHRIWQASAWSSGQWSLAQVVTTVQHCCLLGYMYIAYTAMLIAPLRFVLYCECNTS